MNIQTFITRIVATFWPVAMVACLLVVSARAATWTWDGDAGDFSWTNGVNWVGDVAPVNDGTADIVMSSTWAPYTNVNSPQDILSLMFDSSASAYWIYGSTLTVRGGGITNDDTQAHQLDTPIVVAANQTWHAKRGGFTFIGPGETLNADLTIDVDAGSVTINAAISGTGALVKDGTRVLNLGGVNSYAGGTTINDGTLRIQTNNVMPDTGQVTINPNGIMDLNNRTDTIGPLSGSSGSAIMLGSGTLTVTSNSGSATFSGVISETGSFTKAGSFTQVLGGANTYTGNTSVSAGTLQISTDERLEDSSDLTITSGTFDLQTYDETVDVVTLESGSIIGSGTLIGSTYNVESGLISAALGGTGDLTKSTSGTVALANNNTYAGVTNVTGGSLLLTVDNTLLPDTAFINLSGGTSLEIASGTTQSIDGLSGAGVVVFEGSNLLTIGGGNSSSNYSGVISGDGNLTKVGTGTLTLTGANTYSGSTTVSEGTLQLSSAGERLGNSSNLLVNGGTFSLQYNETVDHVSLASGSITGTGTLNANSFVAWSGSIDAVLGGSGGLTKWSGDTVTLTKANTFSGTTEINDGTLILGLSESLPNATNLTIHTGASLQLNSGQTQHIDGFSGDGNVVFTGANSLFIGGNDASTTFAGSISGEGNLIKSGIGSMSLSGANTYTGTTTVSDGTLQIATASERLADSSDLTIGGGIFDLQTFTETVDIVTLESGSIVGSGTLIASSFHAEGGTVDAALGGNAGLTKSTAGTVTLNNANTYTGPTSVDAGTLILGVTNALVTDTADVTVASGAKMQIASGTSQSIDELHGAGDVEFAGSSSLSVGGNNGSSSFAGVLIGDGTLIKQGTGALTLAGANSYTGPTVINDGVLQIAVSERLADSSDLTVSSGTFDLQSYDETVDEVTLQGGAITGSGVLTAGSFNVESGVIGPVLAGSAILTKSTAGTVTLSATNTYTGGTVIGSGVLEVSSDSNLGTSGTEVTFDGGTLRTTNSFTLSRPIVLGAGGGSFDTVARTTLTETITGTGTLTKEGLGTLVLNTVSPALGSLAVNVGELELPIGGTLNVAGAVTVGDAGFMALEDALINVGTFDISGEITLLAGSRLNGPVSNSGLLSGQGRISGALTNQVTGEVRVGNVNSLRFTGATAHSNAGLVEVLGGEVEFDAAVTNAASTGLIAARNASLRFDGGLANSGSLALSFGTSDVFGSIINDGSASIVVSGGSQVTFYDDIDQNGTFRVSRVGSSNGIAVVLGDFTGSGGTTGGGDIFFEGDLRPGNSTASVLFGNDIGFGSAASLEIEIGGSAQGNHYDTLVISGGATLDGDLVVSLIDPLGGNNLFVPSAGDTFEILSAGELLGTFASESFPTIPGKPGLEWLIDYDTTLNSVLLSVAPIFEADFDEDGDVDGDDLARWQAGYGTGALHIEGDADADGDVDGRDFLILQRQFGSSIAFSVPSVAVPEPSAAALLMTGMLPVFARRWRR